MSPPLLDVAQLLELREAVEAGGAVDDEALAREYRRAPPARCFFRLALAIFQQQRRPAEPSPRRSAFCTELAALRSERGAQAAQFAAADSAMAAHTAAESAFLEPAAQRRRQQQLARDAAAAELAQLQAPAGALPRQRQAASERSQSRRRTFVLLFACIAS